jgi:ribosomal protein S18 acetylase RimI-like enzyme
LPSPRSDDEIRRGVAASVLPERQVALYLCQARVRHGRAARPIRLYCFQQNQAARRFYERHGFAPIA